MSQSAAHIEFWLEDYDILERVKETKFKSMLENLSGDDDTSNDEEEEKKKSKGGEVKG